MVKGDIFLAPRILTDPYNLGHSFTKIGYPMAVGLPVVASPVPSYLKSPAVICDNDDCWFENIKNLIDDYNLRNHLGNKGISYCKLNFSKKVLMKKYLEIFNKILLD